MHYLYTIEHYIILQWKKNVIKESLYLLGYCQSVGVDLVDTPIVIASDKGSIVELVPVKYMLWLKLGVVQPSPHTNEKKNEKETTIKVRSLA